MTMRFVFWETDVSGTTAVLWSPSSAMAIPMPTAAETVNNSEVTFDVDTMTEYILTLHADGDIFFRTGIREPGETEIDPETGDFNGVYFVIRESINIPADDVSGLSPTVPIVVPANELPFGVSALSITTVTVAIVGNSFTATGTAAATILGAPRTLTFTYIFDLKPFTNPLNTNRILNVETISFAMTDTTGDGFGWLFDFLLGVVATIFEEQMVSSMEDTVQTSMDANVADMLAANEAPAGTTVTVKDIDIDTTDGVTIDAFAAISATILANANVCPSAFTSGSVRFRPLKQVNALRRVRDGLLIGNPQGEAYTHAFKNHSRELVLILLRYPEVLKMADGVVEALLKDFGHRDLRKAQLSRRTARLIFQLGENTMKVASPRLRITIEALLKQVNPFIENSAYEVLAKSEKLGR